MNLTVGAKLGPYEILGPLGSGGMGDVLRARDARLGRDVAVKVLPASFIEDAVRLRRFEQEARAAGLLNHPNLLAVYDAGTHDGLPYIVSELLEGDTLRAVIRDEPLPLRKAIDYGVQICRGLAAAHDKKIVHRDLKPENVFVTKDGRVKILDFGLAKAVVGSPMLLEEASTGNIGTTPGVVLGTTGYLSPEQIRGRTVDHRSDIFCFGIVLYEMLTGRRAFKCDSPVETMTAILREEPPPLTEDDGVPPALALILHRCLEKSPDQRFQSAQDLAFDLESLVTRTGQAPVLADEPARRRLSAGLRFVPAALALAAAGAVTGHFLWRTPAPSPPSFKQLTFRRGCVGSARFAPDGQTILYSASWQGDPMEVFSTRLDSPESRTLGFQKADLLSVSRSGEMALLLDRRSPSLFTEIGTLATVPFGGSAPRKILDDVEWAEWSPDGKQLAIVRSVDGRHRLEFPIGRTLHETTGWLSHPRFAPDGKGIAVLEHPGARDDDSGSVVLVTVAGAARTLSKGWFSLQGLAYSGDVIWVTASRDTSARALHAVTASGTERLVARFPQTATLRDVAPDGRALITFGTERGEVMALAPGAKEERDLSWFDWSVITDLSDDGQFVLFHEIGASGSVSTYLRKTDGSPAIRLGEGTSAGLSPDGRWVLVVKGGDLVLLPTGAGTSVPVLLGDVRYEMARWFPDGRILILGRRPGEHLRLFVQSAGVAAPPRPLGGEAVALGSNHQVSPDGRLVPAGGADGRVWLYPLDGGQPRAIPGVEPGDHIVRWSADGRFIYLFRNDDVPATLVRVDPATGRREHVRDFAPGDRAGVVHIGLPYLTADTKAYAYSSIRFLSSLDLVTGLR